MPAMIRSGHARDFHCGSTTLGSYWAFSGCSTRQFPKTGKDMRNVDYSAARG
uniref:Uncharacterized protein n=1 Tax=Candidatus Kentrum sp. LPFa TaxID=2126335 RepID=A0A450X2X9_9GAMM|nr:MAG: hypothetical protein BECKLPF1236A_GA0070988_103843 [Candidatus Kentron sp. LPFa]VFK35467.1 MAG: hypothetical protein BECKLPF1236C_GA0070990_103783 [Candidatus Kentron sp. LPFa]